MLPILPYYKKSRMKRKEIKAIRLMTHECHQETEETTFCESEVPNEFREEEINEENNILDMEIDNNTNVEEIGFPVQADYESPVPENNTNEFREEEINEENDILDMDIDNNTNVEEIGFPVQADYESPVSENNSRPCATGNEKLFHWTNKFKISESCYSELTNMLADLNLDEVPIDLRQLKKQRLIGHECFSAVEEVDAGNDCKMMYFGIASNIFMLSKNHRMLESIKLYINIDGLPLFRSSSKTFWTILGKVPKICNRPFIIGLSYGDSKPDLDMFLQPFVDEVNEIADAEIYIDENLSILLEPKDIVAICDVPAKCYCKNVKGHTGYNSCHYCKIEGVNIASEDGRSNQRIFLETNCEKRTMDCFQDNDDSDHCSGPSPFLEIVGFDIVEQFPLDGMHLCFLGVTKRLLSFYVKGVRNSKIAKLSAAQISQLSTCIKSFSTYFPPELPRRPRGLNTLDKWKAVEFKNFLLYIGIIVLRGIVADNVYEHFLMLSLGIRILNSNLINYPSYMDCAQAILITFVEHAPTFLGRKFMSFNVHSLIHLVDQCQNFGKLLDFSAFTFENFLFTVKESVTSGKNPLESVKRKMETHSYACYEDHDNKQKIIVGHCTLKSENEFEIRSLTFNSEIMSKKKCNCYWMLKENDMIIKVIKIVRNVMDPVSRIIVKAQRAEKMEDYFTRPIPSKDVGIFKVIFQNNIVNIQIEEIKCKVLGLPIDQGTLIFQFCHHFK